MELDSNTIGKEDAAALKTAMHGLLLKSHPELAPDDVAVDVYKQVENRRRVSDRPVIRITVIKRDDPSLDTHAIADSVVTSFEDGSIHDELPSFPAAVRVVVHVQREVLGEWTCLFNSDKPDNDFGDGDVESVDHILSHLTSPSLCDNDGPPNGIHCQTTDGIDYKSAGQKLSVPCLLGEGLQCRSSDNSDPCLDYAVQFHCPGKPTAGLVCTDVAERTFAPTRRPTPTPTYAPTPAPTSAPTVYPTSVPVMPSLGSAAVALAVQLAESIAAGNSSAAREVASSAQAPELCAIDDSWSMADGKILSMTVEPSGQLRLKAAGGTVLASGSLAVGADGSTVSLAFTNGTAAAGTLSNAAPSSIVWSSGGLKAWARTSGLGTDERCSGQLAKTNEGKALYAGKTLQDQDFNAEVKHALTKALRALGADISVEDEANARF